MSLLALRRRAAAAPHFPAYRKFSTMVEPWVQIHRGAGRSIAMDGALSSLDLTASLAPSPTSFAMDGGDIQYAFGSLVVEMHDDTVDRTTDGTGSITGFNLAAFKALRLRNFPYTLGTISSEAPPTFSEWLDRVASYNYVSTPEIKDDSVPLATSMYATVVSKGMRDSVIFGSFWSAPLTYIKQQGLPVSLFQSESRRQSAATILTSINGGPPDIVGYDYAAPSLDNAWLSALIAGGVKLWPFTFNGRRYTIAAERTRISGLGGTCAAITSDNPFYSGAVVTPRTTDRFASQPWEHGIIPSDESATPKILSGKLQLRDAASQTVLMGGFCPVTSLTSAQVTFTLVATDTTTTRQMGIYFGGADDRNHYEGVTAGTNKGRAYFGGIRQGNGNLTLFRRDGDGSATAIATEVATTGALTAGATPTLKAELLAGNVVKLTRVDTGHSIQATDSTLTRGPYWGVCKTGAAGMTADVSAVTVVGT